MPRIRIAIVLLLVGAGTAGAQSAPRRPAAAPPDAASVDAIISALYASVSHAADARPDFDRMRKIFLYVGMLVPPKAPDASDFRVMDVDQFAERVEKAAAARKEKGEAPTGFFEREASRRTDCFGNVCHVFSTYESRHSPSDAAPFQRGERLGAFLAAVGVDVEAEHAGRQPQADVESGLGTHEPRLDVGAGRVWRPVPGERLRRRVLLTGTATDRQRPGPSRIAVHAHGSPVGTDACNLCCQVNLSHAIDGPGFRSGSERRGPPLTVAAPLC